MREISLPALVELPDTGGLADMAYRNAAEEPAKAVFSRKVGDAWQNVTARQFRDEVANVAKGLIASGIGHGDRVGIFSGNSYEWTLFDFAIWAVGGVPVPIYATSSAEQVQWILADSGAVGVVTESADFEAKVAEVRQDLPELKHLWQVDGGAVGSLVEAGKDVSDEQAEERRKAVRPSDIATLIYTSGTTGRPKGCVLTHANFFAECGNGVELLAQLFKGGTDEGASTLLFLPLAHVFGRMVEVGCVLTKARMGHLADVKKVAAELPAFQPTYLLSVPYVLEKVYNGARQKAHAGGKGKIFDAAAATAIAYSEADGRAGLGLKVRHTVFDKLVYSKLRAALGGQVKYVISGGSALGSRLTHFFRGAGVTVLEGYGLTETTAAATVNSPTKFKPGTVGLPLPGSEVKISEDGEILLRGGQLFSGYWNNATATKDAIDSDGWFASGDLGELDQDGFLKITGRKKEILVTSGGKNVAPAVIEDRIAAHPLVAQAMVVGDGKSYIAALITIDQDYLTYWKSSKGKPAEATLGELIADPDLNAEIQQAVDEGNQAVSQAESVRKFRILTAEFSPESGHLTPSLKLKRGVIMKDFASDVESLYS